jgi:acyl-CoA thioesterase YciA
MSDDQPPSGEPALRTFAMPKDANANGDIFGGWLMAQMDLAGAVAALRRARGRVATVAVDAMQFHRPVMVGDLSSITIKIDSFVERRAGGAIEKVTEATFTFVALDESGRPRPVDGPGK